MVFNELFFYMISIVFSDHFSKMSDDKKRQREEDMLSSDLESPVKKSKIEPDEEVKALLGSIQCIKQAIQMEHISDRNDSKATLEAKKILKWMIDYYRARPSKEGVRWCYVDISGEVQELLTQWGIRVEQNVDHSDWWNLYP